MKMLADSVFKMFQPRTFCFAEQDAAEPAAESAEASADDLAETIAQSEEEDQGNTNADELEEVEFDGKKIKVTKGYKDGYLREDDYRKKTHGLGEERRKIDADRNALAQERALAAEFDEERLELKTIEKKLAEYDKVTPEQWLAQKAKDRAEGTTFAEDAQFEEAQLRKAREKITNSMAAKYQHLQGLAKQRQEAWEAENNAAIQARIKDWSPEKEKAIKTTVATQFGLDPKMLEGVKDAGILSVMDWIHNQVTAVAKAKAKLAAAKAEQEQQVISIPTQRVRGNNAPAGRGATADTLKRSPAAFDDEVLKKLYPSRARN